MEKIGTKPFEYQFVGTHPIIRQYKGNELITNYRPSYDIPNDWQDIRESNPINSVVFYVGHSLDYSQYDTFGVYNSLSDDKGYKVYIDGVQYGDVYNNSNRFSIRWSTSGITTGDLITDPETLKAHKIVIVPVTDGAYFTLFRVYNSGSSSRETQGVLWAHFNFTPNYTINLQYLFYSVGAGGISCPLVKIVTSTNDRLNVNSIAYMAYGCSNLKSVPIFSGLNDNLQLGYTFSGCQSLKTIRFQDANISGTSTYTFRDCYNLEDIITKNVQYIQTNLSYLYVNCYKLKQILPLSTNISSISNMSDFIVNMTELEDIVLDLRDYTNLTTFGAHGDATHFVGGFKGLRVSNQAPLNGNTTPINISYTGMDRDALVTLFNDLPQAVSDRNRINIRGCTGTNSLTAEDKEIATNKGWVVQI